MYTFDELTVSDLHKDAYGIRPSQRWWNAWNIASDADKQFRWDRLVDTMNLNLKLEQEQEDLAVAKFELLVEKTIKHGAKDRTTALSWIMNSSNCSNDWEYLAYLHGLPYKYEFLQN